MKKIILFLAAFYLTTLSFSQSIVFDSLGRVRTITLNGTTITTAVANASISLITDDQLSDGLGLITRNYQKTHTMLLDPNYRAFLIRYLHNNNYQTLLTFYSSFATTSPFYTALNTNNSTKYYYSGTKNTLYGIDIFNKTLGQVYNLRHTALNVTDSFPRNLDSLKVIANFVNSKKDSLAYFRNEILKPNDFSTLYSSLYKFLNRINPENNRTQVNPNLKLHPLTKIQSMMQSTWVKEWLWMRKGKMAMNPFDFTSKEFVLAKPEYDETKAKLYNQFIDSAIANHFHTAKADDLEKFKIILREKGRGHEVFAYQTRYDSLVANNEKNLKTISNCTLALNKLRPDYIGHGENFLVSTVSTTSITPNNTRILTNPFLLSNDSAKKIAILNVKQGDKLYLDKKFKSIADKSSFQNTFDTLISQVGIMATIIANYTPYYSMLEALQVKSNAALTPKTNQEKLDFQMEGVMLFDGVLTVREKNELQEYFDKTTGESSSSFTDKEAKIKQVKADLEKKLSEYIYDYDQLAEIFCNTTIPPSTITATVNENASYSTVLARVSPPDKVSENFIKIGTVSSKKDTVILKDFKFNAGKEYRFMVSAGIVGNPAPNVRWFIQTSVEKDANGQIKVKNTAQPFNFFIGLNVYLGKHGLFIQDDGFKRKHANGSRLSALAGVGITKKPLDNLFLGMAYDVVPGLKINLLGKFFRNDDYVIRNDEIIYQKVVYRLAPSIGVSIDAAALAKGISNIFKLNGSK